MRRAAAVLPLAALLLMPGCENRQTPRSAGGIAPRADVRQLELQPGVAVEPAAMKSPYEGNAYAIAEGKRLYGWYNCGGCHFAGGGGIGPPLMDDDWIYGDRPQNILDSIMEGRANGMPSYRGKLPQDDALKIVAYVRSLSRDADAAVQRDRKTEDTGKKRLEEFEKEHGGRRADEESSTEESESDGSETTT
jgi:cytochrome c oxidase cbb3-type subunit III